MSAMPNPKLGAARADVLNGSALYAATFQVLGLT